MKKQTLVTDLYYEIK